MTDVIEPNGPDDLLAAEYVLGVLPHGERQSFSKRLDNEPHLQDLVRFWDEHLSSMSDEISPVAPPARVLEEIRGRLFPASTQSKAPGIWGSLVFWRGFSLASLVALVALSLWNAGVIDFGSGAKLALPETFVAQLSGDAGVVELVTYVDTGTGELRYNRISGNPASDRSFELWFIEGDNPPLSLGVLSAEPVGKIDLDERFEGILKGGTLAISDEPVGGSPTGSPTGAVLAVGSLSEI